MFYIYSSLQCNFEKRDSAIFFKICCYYKYYIRSFLLGIISCKSFYYFRSEYSFEMKEMKKITMSNII